MCLSPRLIENPKYKVNEKNGGNVPVPIDKRALLTPVGCGECIECRKKKAREIQIRLGEEIKTNKNGIFTTLTFNKESYTELHDECKKETGLDGYDLDNAIASLAIRRFTERWRKKYKQTVRHWLITELGHGETEHIHIHGLLFVEPEKYIKTAKKNETIVEAQTELIKSIWQYGRIHIGNYVNQRSVNYITKYITKVDGEHKYYKPKIYTSKGIGAGYLESYNAQGNKYKGKDTKQYYKTKTGHKIALPIYYRNKIYTEEEREKLWMYILDEERRYVLGQEIDISKGEEEYYNALASAREVNERLGYGTGEIDWKRKAYERQRRRYLQRKKIIRKGGL